MTREQARLHIRAELENHLRRKGINTRKPFRCLNPAHIDNNPSMSYDKKRQKAHCFSCNADYDTLDLIGIDYGLDGNSLFLKAFEIFGLTVDGIDLINLDNISQVKKQKEQIGADENVQLKNARLNVDYAAPDTDYTAFFREACRNIGETDYPQRRGLSDDVVSRFMLGFVADWKHPKAPYSLPSPRLIIPTGKHSYLARDTRMGLSDRQEKYSKSKVGRIRVFNPGVLQTAKTPIFVTEGEIDALSIMTLGGEALALGSAGNAKGLIRLLERQLVYNQKPVQPLIIALDNDPSGWEASQNLSEAFKLLEIDFWVVNPYGEYLDANLMLIKAPGAFRIALRDAESECLRNMGQNTGQISQISQYPAEALNSLKIDRFDSGMSSYPQGYVNANLTTASVSGACLGFTGDTKQGCLQEHPKNTEQANPENQKVLGTDQKLVDVVSAVPGQQVSRYPAEALNSLKIDRFDSGMSSYLQGSVNANLTTTSVSEACLGFTENIKSVDSVFGQDTQDIETETAEYAKTNAAKNIQGFRKGIIDSINTSAVPTGFENLDQILDGGLFEGLVIIGAISSLGKTTFILQVADQIAQKGHDVLVISLEMSRFELMSKSISRHTIMHVLQHKGNSRNAKTARGITDGKRYAGYSTAELELINNSVNAYESYAKNIYIHEGLGDVSTKDIRQTVEKHIHLTQKRPVVVVDYVQILSPQNERMTDKQAIDRNVLELKRISRDFKIPVIGISSFNRANYNTPVTMEAFKESGAVEYSSDILMGLQLAGAGDKDFDVNAEKRKNPRNVELVILKNRNGATGDKVSYEYYPFFNYFKEV